MIPFSVLDLVPITEGSNASRAFHNMLDLAQHCEKLGFKRYWLAEHHGMPSIASAATSVLIGQVGRVTETIRIGAGGIMLPNHSPLVIAEQFGTLESLFPGRVDLGLGRAPGSDPVVAHALRRSLTTDPEAFPEDVQELMDYFSGKPKEGSIVAVPGAGLSIPIWILGSSLFGAQLAAKMGLPFGFASHFAPAMMMEALAAYRSNFQPSKQLAKPYVMLGFNVFAADTDREAAFHASSVQQGFINSRTGQRKRLPPPVDNYLKQIGWREHNILEQILTCSAIGSPAIVEREIKDFLTLTQADELMITCQMYDHAARRRSFEIVADIWKNLPSEPSPPAHSEPEAPPPKEGVLQKLAGFLSPAARR
jgi:luciferase family oxidoreductase group 1